MHKIKEEDSEYLEKIETYSQPKPIRTRTRSRGGNNYRHEPEESLSERLWALTEMFPTPVRSFAQNAAIMTANGAKTLFGFTCSASWMIFTGSLILFAPLIFEAERATNESPVNKTRHRNPQPGRNQTPSGPAITLPLIR